MADSFSFKVHLFDLLRDQQQWTAFSSSVEEAQRIARGWGVDLKPDAARVLITVLGRFQREIVEATADFLNAGFQGVKDDRLLLVDGVHSSPIAVAASGVHGTGGGPRLVGPWEWPVRIDPTGMRAIGEVVQYP